MKKIFLQFIIIATPVIALISCNKLDQQPRSAITSDQFYKTQSDAIAAVTAIYSELTYDAGEQPLYGREINFLADMTTDDLSAGPSAINPNVRALSSITYTATDDRVDVVWRQLYTGIARANIAIDRIPAIAFDTTQRARLVREAKFLRGLFYFDLVRFWGDVPLVIHTPSSAANLTSLNVNRSPSTAVYAQIIADLTDAQNLPASYTGADLGRATGGAAKALLAKVYLTQKDWAAAAEKANEVITGPYGYALFANYADVFNPATKNGKEHIFSSQISSNGGLGNSSTLMGAAFAGFKGNVPADIPADSGVYKIFGSNDTRRSVTFYSSLVNPATGTSFTFPSFYLGKYVDRSQLLTPNQSNINFPILRYADVLLIYAEALNELNGPTADAYSAINQVRNRAQIASLPLTLSQSDFRDSLYTERRREFVQEAQRWFDLVRTGRLVQQVQKVATKTNVSATNNLFPVPATEISINPGLTQNPGYN